MYTLVAEIRSPAWSGEIAREAFATIEDAEKKMTQWARFGVDSYCNEPDILRIFDEAETEVRRWSWRRRRSETVEAGAATS